MATQESVAPLKTNQAAAVVKTVSLKFQFVKTSKCLQLPTPGSMSRLFNILQSWKLSFVCVSPSMFERWHSKLKETAIKAVILIPLTIFMKVVRRHEAGPFVVVTIACDVRRYCL